METMSTQPKDRPTIILVDDDDEDRLLMRMALESIALPAPIKELESGEELLRFLHGEVDQHPGTGQPPWIVVLDKYMPGLDGFATLRRLKEHAVLQQIPVVLFVNTQNEEDMELCVDLGAMFCINKPQHFEDTKDLMKMVYQHWLDRASLQT